MFEHIPKILICLICLICFPIDVALQRCLEISRGHNGGTSNSLVMFRYTEVGLLRIAIWTERFPDIPRVKSRELAVVSWSLLLLQQERGIWVKQSDFSGETHPPPQALGHFWKQMVTSSNPASGGLSSRQSVLTISSQSVMNLSFRAPSLGLKSSLSFSQFLMFSVQPWRPWCWKGSAGRAWFWWPTNAFALEMTHCSRQRKCKWNKTQQNKCKTEQNRTEQT